MSFMLNFLTLPELLPSFFPSKALKKYRQSGLSELVIPSQFFFFFRIKVSYELKSSTFDYYCEYSFSHGFNMIFPEIK
jgi:hypothetical protein